MRRAAAALQHPFEWSPPSSGQQAGRRELTPLRPLPPTPAVAAGGRHRRRQLAKRRRCGGRGAARQPGPARRPARRPRALRAAAAAAAAGELLLLPFSACCSGGRQQHPFEWSPHHRGSRQAAPWPAADMQRRADRADTPPSAPTHPRSRRQLARQPPGSSQPCQTVGPTTRPPRRASQQPASRPAF
jgi:hypothetical protein